MCLVCVCVAFSLRGLHFRSLYGLDLTGVDGVCQARSFWCMVAFGSLTSLLIVPE
jgi:hypothetical protein